MGKPDYRMVKADAEDLGLAWSIDVVFEKGETKIEIDGGPMVVGNLQLMEKSLGWAKERAKDVRWGAALFIGDRPILRAQMPIESDGSFLMARMVALAPEAILRMLREHGVAWVSVGEPGEAIVVEARRPRAKEESDRRERLRRGLAALAARVPAEKGTLYQIRTQIAAAALLALSEEPTTMERALEHAALAIEQLTGEVLRLRFAKKDQAV